MWYADVGQILLLSGSEAVQLLYFRSDVVPILFSFESDVAVCIILSLMW